MTKLMLSTATALGLFLTPTLAEQAKTDATAAGNAQIESQAGDGAAAATATGADGSATSAKSDRMNDASADAGSDASASTRTAANEVDRQARDNATRSATQAGMTNVAVIDRAFVLEGTNSAGNKVYMIVNPPGVLVGIGGPVETASADMNSGSATSNASDTAAKANADMTVTGSISKDDASDKPRAGEPADSGYMATQAQPASPAMWDIEAMDRDMKRFGLDKSAQ